MATTKMTITLPDDQLKEIRALAASGATPNISAFVKHAVGVALRMLRDGGRCCKRRFSRRVAL